MRTGTRRAKAWMRRAALLAIIGLMAACMPRLQPLGPLATAPQLRDHKFTAQDGATLPVRIWLPDGEPKAVILAIHGFNDYANAFLDPANYWRRYGIATYAYDQRGFGNTPNRGLWPGTDVLTDDAAEMTRLLHGLYPHTPLYVLGESMGGAVAAVMLARDGTLPVDGLILCAPAVWTRNDMGPLQSGMLWLAAHSVPWMTVTGRGLGITPSDNIAMLRALARDPLVIKDTRIDTIYGLADLMDAGMTDAGNIHVPVLVLYGDHDEIIPRDPTIEFLSRLHKADPHAYGAFYPKGYHMLLRDLDGETVMKDVKSWIADAQAPLPSGAEAHAAQALAAR